MFILMSVFSCLRRIFLAATVLGVSALAAAVPVAMKSSPADAAAPPTYAYLSSENGHFSHVVNTSTQSWGTSVGDFQPSQNNWRCNRMTNTVNNAGTKVYNAASCQGNAAAIDTATGTFSLLPFVGTAMTVSKDDQFMYVVRSYERFKFKLSDNSIVWQVLSPGYRPWATQYAFAASQDDSKIYVPMQDRFQNVGVLDAATGSTITEISNAAWSSPSWTVASPVGTNIFVGTNNGIAVIDSSTNTYTRLIPVTAAAPAAVSADGNLLYLSNGSNIKKVRVSDGTVLDTYAVGCGEGGIALTPDGDYLYAVTGSGVSIIRLSDGNISSLTYPSTTPYTSVGRTIVMATRVEAPSISLSRSSATANVDNAVSGLYSISNTGGTPTSYSISPSTLAAGLSFSTSTGLITGTPTATRAATTYTITATNVGGSSSDTFSLAVTDPPDAPTPTFSLTTSTVVGFTFSITNFSNSYTYSVSATNGAIATHSAGEVTVTGLSASGTSTVTVTSARSGFRASSATASGRAQDATTTTTTVPAAANGLVSGGGNTDASIGGNTGSTTTVPSRISTMATTTTVPSRVSTTTTTTTTIPAPDAPTANPGSGVLVIDGEETTASVTRTNNRVTVGAAGVSVTFNGIAQDGTIVPLDSEGNLRLTGGNSVSIEGAGFAANQDVEVWMFSTPQLLATVKADSNGKVVENIKLSSMLEEGNHRFVVDGTSAAGADALVALGIIVGYESSGLSTTGKLLIALPIALAIIIGLVIPTTLRRRKKTAHV
jgi:protein involved in ribonucleotide reduction